MNGKSFTEKGSNWGKLGGGGHMSGFRGTGRQEPGQSAQEGTGPRRGIEAKGGNNNAFYSSGASNKDYAGTQQAGTSGPTKTGGDSKFAQGGSTKMFGNRGSQKATPA